MSLINVQSLITVKGYNLSKKNKRTIWKVLIKIRVQMSFFSENTFTLKNVTLVLFSLDRHVTNQNWQFRIGNFLGFFQIQVLAKLREFSMVLKLKN